MNPFRQIATEKMFLSVQPIRGSIEKRVKGDHTAVGQQRGL
jgi:hypothetical protein